MIIARWLAVLFAFFATEFVQAETTRPAAIGTDLVVLAADDRTLQPLLQRLENSHIEVHAVWTFWVGQLDGKSVVLARAEGDPLNAVAATTLAIRLYPPRLILTFGTARAHDPALRPGDVVISEKFAAFDGINSPPTPLGGGSDALQWTPLPHALMTGNEIEKYTKFFPADAAAAECAITLKADRGRVLRGVLGSANQENHEPERIALLRSQWQTSSEDAESAHIAGCAALFNIPVVGIRVIDGSPAEAAEIASRFLAKWK